MRSLISVITLSAAVVIGLQFVGSKKAPANELDANVSKSILSGVNSTLFCKNREDSLSVLTAFDEDGDKGAFATAEALLSDGKCSFQKSITFFPSSSNLLQDASFKPFEEETACEQTANGFCISIQHGFFRNQSEEIVAGYFLVSQVVNDVLPEVQSTRLEAGLILDMN